MDWKKLGKRILFPPVFLQLPLVIASAAGLIWVFLEGHEASPLAYGIYALSFYTLSVVSLFCILVLPNRYRQIKQRVMSVPIANRFVTDRVFRTEVLLNLSLLVNLLYAAVNGAAWFAMRSWWFVCLAVYYVILSVMRWLLARYVRRHDIGTDRYGELKRAVACSYILLLVNVFLSGAVLMILYQDKGYEYPGILIYVMAAYTFYITVNAIVNLFRYRKFGSPVMSTAKIISMAAALVSMLNLETAMFASFGADMALEHQRLMIILTGAGVAIAVIWMSVYMIVRCSKEMKQFKEQSYGSE